MPADFSTQSGLAIHFVNEAFRHGKPIAFLGEGTELMEAANLPNAEDGNGIVTGDDVTAFVEALLQHRFPRRAIDIVPA